MAHLQLMYLLNMASYVSHVYHGHLRSDRYGYGVRRTQPGHERPAMLVLNAGQLYLPCLSRIEKWYVVFLFEKCSRNSSLALWG